MMQKIIQVIVGLTSAYLITGLTYSLVLLNSQQFQPENKTGYLKATLTISTRWPYLLQRSADK